MKSKIKNESIKSAYFRLSRIEPVLAVSTCFQMCVNLSCSDKGEEMEGECEGSDFRIVQLMETS
jgi:hypothetical protein